MRGVTIRQVQVWSHVTALNCLRSHEQRVEISFAGADKTSDIGGDGLLNFFQRQDCAFDLPNTILCDLDFCAEDLERAFKRLSFSKLWVDLTSRHSFNPASTTHDMIAAERYWPEPA